MIGVPWSKARDLGEVTALVAADHVLLDRCGRESAAEDREGAKRRSQRLCERRHPTGAVHTVKLAQRL